MLRSARNPVECAFGQLKAQWSMLTKKVDLGLDFVPTAIYACFVLHNYCELNKCAIDSKQVTFHIELEKKERECVHPHPVLSGNLGEGEVARDVLQQYIENCLNTD